MSARWRQCVAALAVIAAACAHGCAGEEPALAPPTATAIVEGQLPGPLQDDYELRLERVRPSTGLVRIVIPADGAFRAEIPAGDYRVGLEARMGTFWLDGNGAMSYRSSLIDTLSLAPSATPHRLRLPVGMLRVAGDLPPGMTGATVSPELRVREGTLYFSLGTWRSTIVGDNLDLECGLVPAGNYAIRLNWGGGAFRTAESYWLPGTVSVDSAGYYRVGADSTCTAVLQPAAEQAHLIGRVTGAWQLMRLSPPSVFAYDGSGRTIAGPWRVEEDGNFDLPLHLPRAVHLAFDAGNCRAWVGGATREESTLHQPTPGAVVNVGEHRLSGALVRLAVADLVDRWEPANVVFHDPSSLAAVFQASILPNRQEVIAFAPAGDYLVEIRHATPGAPAWIPQWFDGAADAAGATIVTVPAEGGVVSLAASLDLGGFISGCVTSAPQPGFEWAVLTSADSDIVIARSWWSIYFGDTCMDFEFGGLRDGAYKVGAWRDGSSAPQVGLPAPAETAWYPDGGDWNAAAPVIIAGADSVTGLVIPAP